MSNQGGSKGMLVRLAVIAVLGATGVIIALNMKSPLSISESEVRRIVRERELIGLTLKEAAKKLQHAAPDTVDGTVVFAFDQVESWKAGRVCVDVMNGRVTAVSWLSPGEVIEEGSDVRQDQGDGSAGGSAQGQGAPTGIRAKNQTSGGGGPR